MLRRFEELIKALEIIDSEAVKGLNDAGQMTGAGTVLTLGFMPKKRRVLRMVAPPTTRVRYGRATLTIAQTGGIAMSELNNAVADYESGDLTAELLCERFVRTRVTGHSPSFSWDEVDLVRVLKLVVDASEEPQFKSADVERVADRLVAAAAEERKALQEETRQLREALQANLPKFTGLSGGNRMPWLQDALKGLHEAGNMRKKLGLERIGPQLDAMRGLRSISGFDQKEFKRMSGLAGFKAIDPKLFETAGWVKRLPDPAPWLRELQKQMGSHLEALKLSLPANWRKLTSEEMKKAVELMKAEGLNLAWTPRPEILHQLIAADGHDARCEILLQHRGEIVEDVEQVLGEIERSDLEPIVAAGFEAIETYRDGHPAPAQTYAAAVIGEVIHGSLGYETFGEIKQHFRDTDPMNGVRYCDFPLYAVGRALARTLDRFKDAGNGFNRNLTQHRIGAPHSEANLLMVLLLLGGLLREVERVLDRHDAREEPEAA